MFVLSIASLNTIPKTMIFVDNINEKMVLMEYLCTKLLDNLKDKVDQIKRCFHFNLSNESRILLVKDFL